jgi:hypothetical protein
MDLETLGIDRAFTEDDLRAIDDALDIDDDVRAVARPGALRSWLLFDHLSAASANGAGNGRGNGRADANGHVAASTAAAEGQG